MRFIILLFLAAVALAGPARPFYSLDKADEYFQQFIETYNKQYASDAEKARRHDIFKHNLDLINQKNAESETAVFGITLFSDLTQEEFMERHTGLKGGVPQEDVSDCLAGIPKNGTTPDSFDWRTKKVISKPKSEWVCQSSWAFSAIANVEAQYAMKHGELVDLSEQQLLDCDTSSIACYGTRRIENPFLYLIKSSGSMEEKDYHYKARENQCRFNESKVKAKVTSCLSFFPKTEEELKSIVYHSGPVSVGIDASALQFYFNGILQNCPFFSSNRAVLLVGYGTENGIPYWVLKNSWGDVFGEKGFYRIKRGVDACGILESNAVVAVVD